jgi:hypothetical protein
MTQEQQPISGLHPQNHELIVGSGKSRERRGLDEYGLATSLEAARQQVEEKTKALERAEEDKTDLDDTPQLSVESGINVADLPVADEDDKRKADVVVAERQAELDKAKENLEKFEALEEIRVGIRTMEEGEARQVELRDEKQRTRDKLVTAQEQIGDDGAADLLGPIINAANSNLETEEQILTEIQEELAVARIYLSYKEEGELSQESKAALLKIIEQNGGDFTSDAGKELMEVLEKSCAKQARLLLSLLEDQQTGHSGDELDREIQEAQDDLRRQGIDPEDMDEVKRLASLSSSVLATGEEEPDQDEDTTAPESVIEVEVDENREEAEKLAEEITTELEAIESALGDLSTRIDDAAIPFDEAIQQYNDLVDRMNRVDGPDGTIELNTDLLGDLIGPIDELSTRINNLMDFVVTKLDGIKPSPEEPLVEDIDEDDAEGDPGGDEPDGGNNDEGDNPKSDDFLDITELAEETEVVEPTEKKPNIFKRIFGRKGIIVNTFRGINFRKIGKLFSMDEADRRDRGETPEVVEDTAVLEDLQRQVKEMEAEIQLVGRRLRLNIAHSEDNYATVDQRLDILEQIISENINLDGDDARELLDEITQLRELKATVDQAIEDGADTDEEDEATQDVDNDSENDGSPEDAIDSLRIF